MTVSQQGMKWAPGAQHKLEALRRPIPLFSLLEVVDRDALYRAQAPHDSLTSTGELARQQFFDSIRRLETRLGVTIEDDEELGDASGNGCEWVGAAREEAFRLGLGLGAAIQAWEYDAARDGRMLVVDDRFPAERFPKLLFEVARSIDDETLGTEQP